jgi:Lrp/AsnC family transcriptional regulator, leucine-responsive regulatory protein
MSAILDDLDHRLLAQLQIDSALSNVELARRVHASEATCLRRVRALTALGVIEKQVAIVAPEALGAGLTAIVEVTLDAQHTERLDGFQAMIVAHPEVTQCYRVCPGPDFILMLLVANMPAYHAFAHRVFTANAHVRNLRVFFSTHRAKFSTQVPVPVR